MSSALWRPPALETPTMLLRLRHQALKAGNALEASEDIEAGRRVANVLEAVNVLEASKALQADDPLEVDDLLNNVLEATWCLDGSVSSR
jgi:hypothetical protein